MPLVKPIPISKWSLILRHAKDVFLCQPFGNVACIAFHVHIGALIKMSPDKIRSVERFPMFHDDCYHYLQETETGVAL